MNRRGPVVLAASLLAASALIVSTVEAAPPAGPTSIVAGSYRYTTFTGGHRSASIAAVATPSVKGVWSLQTHRGTVTCLVVDGQDAWLAGPGTSGPDTGVFMHVHDGGTPGAADDLVTSWGQDPGQPFAELVEWCETKAEHVPLFTVDSGNVTVKVLP
jgi:hypothetical protein